MADTPIKIKTCPVILGSRITEEKGIELTWTQVAEAEKYAVKRCDTYNGKFEIIGWTKECIFEDKEIEEDKTYWYSIFAVRKISKKRTSVKASSVYAAVVSDIKAPESFETIIGDDNKVEIRWEDGIKADSFVIFRRNDYCKQMFPVAAVEENCYTDKDVVPGQVYHYSVQPLINEGENELSGNFSRNVSLVYLDKGEILSAKAGFGKKVKIMFRIVAGADGYILERSADGVNFQQVGRTDSGESIRITDKVDKAFCEYYYRARCFKVVDEKEFISQCTETVCVKSR